MYCQSKFEKIESKKRILKQQFPEIRTRTAKEISDAHERCEAEKAAIKNECENAIETQKSECEKSIQEAKEYIESHREVLSKMDEKTLLANIMIALDGYSQRISRLESALGEEQIAKKLTDIAESTEKKIDGMTTDLLDHMRRLNISTKLDEIATSIISHLQEFDVTLQMSEIDQRSMK